MWLFRRLSGWLSVAVVAFVAGCGGDVAPTSGGSSATTPGDGGRDAGASTDAATSPLPDPFAAAPTCTSGTTWTKGNHGSPEMNPGRACLACHATMNGPDLTIAGTVYPTAHEPDLCFGADGSNDVRVVITGADGQITHADARSIGQFPSRHTGDDALHGEGDLPGP